MKKNITNNLIDYDFSSILELLDFIENSQPITYANSSISGKKALLAQTLLEKHLICAKMDTFLKM